MSHGRVDLARRGIDAFNRRDIELLGELTTPEFEWFPALPGNVEGGGYRGRAGIARYLEEVAETWAELQVLADEFRALADCVLVLGRTEGLGSASGVRVDSPLAMIVDFRGDSISRVRTYLDHREALRAAGFSD